MKDSTPDMTALGIRLRAYRARHGLDVAEAARRLEVSAEDVERWETGAAAPPRLARLGLEAVLAADGGAEGSDAATDMLRALDSADMYAFTYDAVMDHVRRYGALRERFGLPATGTGTSFAVAVHPDDRERLLSHQVHSLTPVPSVTPHYRLRTQDGDWRWLHDICAVTETTPGGAPRRYVGITQDITGQIWLERSLRQSERHLRSILDTLLMFAGLLTPEGDVVWINAAALEMSGLSLDTISGKPFEASAWFGHSVAVRERIRGSIEAAGRGETSRFDVTVRTGGGALVDVDYAIAPLRDEEGRVLYLVPSATEISKRKAAETALAASEERLRLAVDVGRVGIWDWDLASGDLTWSEQHYRFAGYAVGSVRPSFEAFAARVHPEDRARVETRLAEARETRQPYSCTFRFLHPDGTVVHADALGRYYYDAAGAPTRMVGAVRDVTEIIEAQRRIGDSQRRLDTALEAGDMGTFEIDLDTQTVSIDARQAQLLGLPADTRQVSRSEINARIHPDDQERDRAARDATEHHGALYRNAFRIRLEDGGYRWLMGVAKRTLSASGRPLIAGVNFDISEQKAAEERQALLMREVDHRAKNMLATIQAMVMLTARDKVDVDGFVTAIQQRIGAMAHVHKLIAATRWHGARLRSIVDEELAPYVADNPAAAGVAGPDLVLAPKAAIAMAIALHELTTNAAAYGALSSRDGRVDITWTGDSAGGVTLRWAESGGPAVVSPARRGFGTRLIESSVRSDAGGALTTDFAPGGLTCEIRLPADSGRPAAARGCDG